MGKESMIKTGMSFTLHKNHRTQNTLTVRCKIVGNEIFKYPISASEKYQNEFPTPKYVGMDTLIIIIE